MCHHMARLIGGWDNTQAVWNQNRFLDKWTHISQEDIAVILNVNFKRNFGMDNLKYSSLTSILFGNEDFLDGQHWFG